jgi:hypothetical protein
MPEKPLPWASVPGEKYQAQELKPRKQWVKNACWGMCLFLILGGVVTPYRIAVVFGVLYILTLLMKKDTVVTRRGLEVFYQMRIATQYDFWPWSDISVVTREDKGDPWLVALYFTKGDRTRRLYFTRPDAQAVMNLARAQQPRIIVGDGETSRSAKSRT